MKKILISVLFAVFACFFVACAPKNIESNIISMKQGLDFAIREVCWNVESETQCFDILQSTCDSKNYKNCVILGYAYTHYLIKDLSEKDRNDKAAELFKKACEGKNGSGCFALQTFEANPINVIAGCQYGDFIACKDIVGHKEQYLNEVVEWADERAILLINDECEKAELRLKVDKDRAKIREAEVKEYCDLAKAENEKIVKAKEDAHLENSTEKVVE